MRALIDTNVVIDVLQSRQPWCEDGQKIFYAIANKQIEGFITAKEAADIYFVSRRQFLGQENLDQKVRKILAALFKPFDVFQNLFVAYSGIFYMLGIIGKLYILHYIIKF